MIFSMSRSPGASSVIFVSATRRPRATSRNSSASDGNGAEVRKPAYCGGDAKKWPRSARALYFQAQESWWIMGQDHDKSHVHSVQHADPSSGALIDWKVHGVKVIPGN